jgi:PAS domain S-box-containing protein
MGTWSWDAASDEVMWDDMACELFGVPKGPRDFRAWLALVHPDDRARARAVAENGLVEGHGYHLVHRVIFPGGSVRHIEGRADVIVDSSGEAVGLRGVALDVTEREAARLRAERHAAHDQLLADAGVAFATTLEPEPIVRRLTELVVPALGDACEVALLQPGKAMKRFVRATEVDIERTRRREQTQVLIDGNHPIAEVLRSGKPRRLTVEDDIDGTAFGPVDIDTTAASFGITEAAVVPMTVRGETIGVLALGVRPPRSLDDETVELAMELAGRAALAHDNAQLFCLQRSVADTLQRSLFPPELPSLDWVELAGHAWVPGSGVEVGGDFYDVIVAEDEAVLFIGDVCGKGVEAAALTALARHTLRAAILHLRDPVAAVSWLHDGVKAQAPDSFVTAAVVRLRRAGDILRAEAVVAGHPPPLVVRGDGSTEVVNAPGSAPGLPFWEPARPVTFTLGAGDLLLLYTDGVTDVQGDAALSTEELCGIVADFPAGCAEDAVVALGAALERRRPWPLRSDDVAVVVARVTT